MEPDHSRGREEQQTTSHGLTKGLCSPWPPSLSLPRPHTHRCSDGLTPVLSLGATWLGDWSLQNIVQLAVETTRGVVLGERACL